MKIDMFNKKNKDKKINKKKLATVIIIGIIIILIIVGIAAYINNEQVKKFFDKYIFRKEIYEEDLPSISLEGINSNNVFAYGNYIAILNQNKLKLYNKNGNLDTTIDVEISVPICSTNGKYLCIAEENGNKIYLINNKNILWEKEVEGKISDVSINENGYVSISISGTSYKTVVDVLDDKGEDLFKTYLASANVIDTEISNDNKYLAIAEANFSGITIESNIKVISIEKAKDGSSDPIEHIYSDEANALIINLKYQSRNKLVCMYDNKIKCIQENNNEEILNLQDKKNLFVDINLNGKVMQIIEKGTGILNTESELCITDINNNQNVITYSIENIPKQIKTNDDNIIGINTGTEALIINNTGWLIKLYRSEQEIENLVLGEGIAGVISRGKVVIISL